MTTVDEIPLHMRRAGFDPAPDLAAVGDRGVTRVRTPFGVQAWLVTDHEGVRAMLSDTDTFSNEWGIADLREADLDPDLDRASQTEMEGNRAGQLLAYDPPEHSRLRKLLAPEFTVKRMRRLQVHIAEIVDEHLDAMAAAGPPTDLVRDFALPVPSLVICELLGVPYADRAEFQARSNAQLDMTKTPAQRVTVQRESKAYMSSLVERARRHPGDDLLGMLVREHGDEITHDELVGIASLLLIAGHETTANMLGLGTLALLRHPDQLAIVRDEPDRVDGAVEELMRWLSIVHTGIPRRTRHDTVINGTTVPANSLVLAGLPLANRDPALLDDPNRLDVTRAASRHVAFGHGVHHCLGAPLARMEMRTAFPALLRRFPTLHAVGSSVDEPAFRSFSFIYGMESLPVAW